MSISHPSFHQDRNAVVMVAGNHHLFRGIGRQYAVVVKQSKEHGNYVFDDGLPYD